jgi:hypothetical protein
MNAAIPRYFSFCNCHSASALDLHITVKNEAFFFSAASSSFHFFAPAGDVVMIALIENAFPFFSTHFTM